MSNNTENQQKSKFNLKYVVYGALSMMTYLFFGNYFLLLGSFHSDVGGTETITPNGTNETIVIEDGKGNALITRQDMSKIKDVKNRF